MASNWLQSTPFAKDLGLQAMTVTPDTCRFILPFATHNTVGGAIHGGALAGLAVLCSHAMLRAEPGGDDGAPSVASLHIAYLRPAKTQSTWVESRSMGRGDGYYSFETKLLDHDGKLSAQAFATATHNREVAQAFDPKPKLSGRIEGLGEAVEAVPFLARRGIRVEAASAGRVELSLPAAEANLDSDQTLHQGAVAALMDAAGAAAAWTIAGASAMGGGGALSLHASFGSQMPRTEMRARASVRLRAGALAWVDVEVFAAEGRPLALGTVAFGLPASPAS